MIYFKKSLKLFLGIIFTSFAIVLTIYSQLGASPWDVFHLGLTNHTNLTLGQISQLVSVIAIIISMFFGEIPGIATILNMYLIGVFIDIIQANQLIPIATSTWQKFFMLFLGIYLFGWGTYFYLSTGLGSGPRDSLMIAFMKITNMPVWKIRAILETSVLVIGYFLGGLVGIGTILSAFLIGVAIQHVYNLMKSDPAQIKHTTFKDYYLMFKKIKNTKATIKEGSS